MAQSQGLGYEICLLPREKALTFADYLNSRGIPAKAAPGAGIPDYTGCNATPSKCNALHRHKELGPRQQELYEEVAAAVFSLTQRGIRPTNALIRESLGGGSMSTIAPVLHAVMADNAALNAEEGIDVKLRSDFVNGAAKQLLVMLYDMKVREADEKVGGVLSLCRGYQSEKRNDE